MNTHATSRRSLSLAITIALAAVITGCGSKEQPAATTAAPPTPVATEQVVAPAPAAPTPQPTAFEAPAPASWSPEALEDLLAPVALYPDHVLSQVLIASANPQEVLDAGNWLLENQSLSGEALDDAAAAVGFTPPIRALIQFPDTVDMMCRELGWTTELGQAFVADQAGVLDAVQRLRRQAKDVGNLQSSPQMTVETQEQAGKEVIVLEPPSTQTVYVPQYDPVAVYAPPAEATAAAPAAAAPATTTTTTTYFFMLVLIWSAPDVSSDRLFFNILWTLWIVVGSYLEERDLVADFGERYRDYQKTVPMLLPWRFPRSPKL